jgi:hypothetical protein
VVVGAEVLVEFWDGEASPLLGVSVEFEFWQPAAMLQKSRVKTSKILIDLSLSLNKN